MAIEGLKSARQVKILTCRSAKGMSLILIVFSNENWREKRMKEGWLLSITFSLKMDKICQTAELRLLTVFLWIINKKRKLQFFLTVSYTTVTVYSRNEQKHAHFFFWLMKKKKKLIRRTKGDLLFRLEIKLNFN